MASLTKMMTAITTVHLAEEFKLDLKTTYFKVSKNASQTPGTTANLIENQRVTILDLLYGLMLPSGNDAAVTLGENFADILRNTRAKREKPNLMIYDRIKMTKYVVTEVKHTSYFLFVREMNVQAKRYFLKSTFFTNPHGLSDKANHSTANELAIISSHLLKNALLH